jgi:hypothetical protein
MLTKSYTMMETLFVLIVISSFSNIYINYEPTIQIKNSIISEIIHTQYLSILFHKRYDFNHDLINQSIWFNMNGNVNQANTIHINSHQYFTIMLFTGRIHE